MDQIHDDLSSTKASFREADPSEEHLESLTGQTGRPGNGRRIGPPSSGEGYTLQGAGTQIPWTPRHIRRRSSQARRYPSAMVDPFGSRSTPDSTMRHSSMSSERLVPENQASSNEDGIPTMNTGRPRNQAVSISYPRPVHSSHDSDCNADPSWRSSILTLTSDELQEDSEKSPILSPEATRYFPLAPRRFPLVPNPFLDDATTQKAHPWPSSLPRPPSVSVDPLDRRPRSNSRIGTHNRTNFSRPFDGFPPSYDDNEKDTITELPVARLPAAKIRFNSVCSFDDGKFGRPGSLADETLEKNKGEYALLGEEDQIAPARRLGCILQNRRVSPYSIEEEKVVRKIGKNRLRWTRNIFVVFYILINGICIAICWLFPQYWYIFVPVILLGNFLNTLMVLNIIRWFLWAQCKRIVGMGPPRPPTENPTTIAMVLACYCESYDELMATLVSLNSQDKIDQHRKMFIIICDGQVTGKGMKKSTDRILVEDILKPEEEHWFPLGYESWDGVINGIYASAGIWEGTPFVCLVKKRNLGKRDGLILVRTLLHKFTSRCEHPESSMGNDFFCWFCSFSEKCKFERFEWLVGVDADTTFNSTCIYEMHKECLKDPKLIGCSGLIQVGFRTGKWNLWNIYQNTEYIRAQCLRRWHQAHGTGKVSCLPGACQIIKICEETCGDKILIELFGYIPDPKANMIHQVRALAGEDRNYICLIFAHYPKAQTTMSINAIAYTDPPNGMMVFLSQRKRWTLSTCANDMLIISKSEMNWFERLCSLADVIVWVLPVFVMQTFALFIKACILVQDPTFIVCFAIITMVPLAYGIVVTYWGCDTNLLRAQYLLGLLMVVTAGQFVTPLVISYAIWHMDDFSWGKTREVEVSDDPNSKPAHSD